MPIIITGIFFIFGATLGVVVGFVLAAKHKTKAPRDIETSLKKATVIPTVTHKPTDSELMEIMRVETLKKKILYEEELSLIFKMGQEMFSGFNLESLAKIIAENANKIVNAEICTLLLEDKTTGALVPVYSQGVPMELLLKMRFKKGEGISGLVALNNEILIRENIEGDLWLKNQNKGEYFINSLISIPISSQERVIGVLNLSNKRSRQPFSEDEVAFLKGLTTEAGFALQNARLYEQVQENYLRTITALAFALDARDSHTQEHSENVTRYAVAIAREMNLSPAEIESIRRAGLLHDIGKIGIRDNVLLKPGKLNEEEYKDIKGHPLKGEAIVSALPFLREEAKLIRHHHERFDGGGYPDGIKADEIERGARILAVADSFDAMVQDRVYRKALGFQQASEELKKNRGKQFDPEVVDALLAIIKNNPGLILR